MRQYAQFILPAYTRLIALNPANHWEESAFDDCEVKYAATPQQNNREDCGPAAATTIYHILRTEPNEQVFEGRCLRFTHLVMVYNAIYGACPFIFINDTDPYAISDQDSLKDPKLQQLLQRPRPPSPPPPLDAPRFQQDYVIKLGLLNDTKPYAIPNQGSLTDPKLQQLLRRPSDTLRF